MLREVLIYPNAVLKSEAGAVKTPHDSLASLLQDLKDTMYHAGHSVGIAAPQVGALLRVAVVNVSLAKRKCENHGELVLINPEITFHEGLESVREGCMSVPEYIGVVNRASKVAVSYLDETFAPKTVEAVGFEAVVLQHELDHLDGILFIDRVISRKRDLFKRK